MTVSRFNEIFVNSLSHAYKKNYRQRLKIAIDSYLPWLEANANLEGCRFFPPFKHVCHGPSGKKRVANLETLMNNPHTSFFELVTEVGKVLQDSSIRKHSFKRYLYQTMTGEHVVGEMSDADFFNFSFKTLEKEFREKPTDAAEDFSYLALTEGVRVYLKHSLSEEAEEEYMLGSYTA